jgi:hypothetical protein
MMTDAHAAPAPGPYARAAHIYWAAGWRGILPLPPRSKKPVPTGYTGAQGAWPSYPDVHTWTEGPEGAGNLALRMPHHAIGLDVDDYAGKGGGSTLRTLEARYGLLPPTWRSTSRNDGVSGIRLYRVPEGLAWPGDLRGGIEIIQHRHRYTVAWPSVHPETGGTYRWIDPHGNDTLGVVPGVDDLPDLPPAWVEGITGGQAAADTARADLGDQGAATWLEQHGGGAPCRAVRAALARHLSDLTTPGGSRHDAALRATQRLAHLAAEGHPGTAVALEGIRAVFIKALHDGTPREVDPGEWRRMLVGAINIAAVAHPAPTGGDPCDNPFHGLLDRKDTPPWPPPTSSSASSTPSTIPSAPASSTSTTTPDTGSSDSPPNVAAPATPPDDELEQEIGRWQLLAIEVERQRAQRAARRHLDEEEAAASFREPVWRASLVEELAIPDEPVSYLVDQVFPTGANVLLTAQFKAGKTSTVNHLTRCLADDEPFLGRWDVTGLTGRVALWNYEVDERMYRRWLRDVGIANPERVTALNLRGYRMPIVVPRVEDWIVRWLQDHKISVWVVDPFARAFTGSGDSENDNTEVGRFLDTLDVIKHRAGVSELIMPTHTGRGIQEEGRERARGATRLDDWADVRWLLTIDDEEQRYFRATGRDVEVPEGRMEWDEVGRRPQLIGGSRRGKGTLAAEQAVLDGARANPGISLNALRGYVRNRLGKADNNVVAEAITILEKAGRIRIDRSAQATRHYLSGGLEGLVGGTHEPC